MLQQANRIVLVDWPSRDVPDTLVRCGYSVVVKNGPGPDDYAAQVMADGKVTDRPVGRPTQADLIYAFRPAGELPQIVALAVQTGASTVWRQSGRRNDGAADPTGCWVPEQAAQQERRIVESAGLAYVHHAYIADIARALRPG